MTEPDWAGMPPELWRSILSQAGRHHEGQWDADSWAAWCKMVSTAAAVCRNLHAAFLGADSGALWHNMGFFSSHGGLSEAQSRGLNALLAARGHHARTACFCRGGWAKPELRQVLASLSSAEALTLCSINSTSKAGALGAALASTSPVRIAYEGSQPCRLPLSVKTLIYTDSWMPDSYEGIVSELEEQVHAEQVFKVLLPLRQLEHLTVTLSFWALSLESARCLRQQLPDLTTLDIQLQDLALLGGSSSAALDCLSGLQLSLGVQCFGGKLAESVLQKVCSVPLQRLVLTVAGDRDCWNSAHEALLAVCSITQLNLRFEDPARRLQQPLPGVHVVYEPLGCD